MGKKRVNDFNLQTQKEYLMKRNREYRRMLRYRRNSHRFTCSVCSRMERYFGRDLSKLSDLEVKYFRLLLTAFEVGELRYDINSQTFDPEETLGINTGDFLDLIDALVKPRRHIDDKRFPF